MDRACRLRSLLLCDVFDKEAKRCWLTRVSSLAAHFLCTGCARVFMDGLVRSFTDHSCFWDFIDFTSMTVLFSQPACVMVLTRLSESSRRGGEEV